MTTYKATSAVIGRMPRASPQHEFKTAFIKLFDVMEPLKTEKFPLQDLVFENTEKVVFNSCIPPLNYYVEGNDLVLVGLTEFTVEKKGHVISVSYK